jgi:outer membrane protein
MAMKMAGALALVWMFAGGAWAQEIKIGWVDLQRALNESEAGAQAKTEFKVQYDKLQEELKKQKQDLEALKERIEKKALVLKDEERRKLERDYQRKLRDFERAVKDSEGELRTKDNELTGAILRDLQQVIQELGEREGYLVILEASGNTMLYGAKSADLTDRLIALYNERRGH